MNQEDPQEVEDTIMDAFAEPQQLVDTPAAADHCLVVDVSNLAYRSSYAYQGLSAGGKPTGHIFGSVRLLLATLKNDLGPGKWCLIFCYDGKAAKAKRQEILPEYKANREDGRFNPIPDVTNVLQYVPGLHVAAADKEGDDAIAWVARHLRSKAKCDVVLLTGDKDMWALTKLGGVRILSPNKKRFVTPDDIKEEYLVEDPLKIYLAKALTGDPSDNIKGIPRLMKKKVAEYLNIPGVYTPTQFYDALEQKGYEGFSKKTAIKLADGAARVEKNFAVVRPQVDGFGPDTLTRTKMTAANQQTLRDLLLSYECRALVEQLDPLFGVPQYVRMPKCNPET